MKPEKKTIPRRKAFSQSTGESPETKTPRPRVRRVARPTSGETSAVMVKLKSDAASEENGFVTTHFQDGLDDIAYHRFVVHNIDKRGGFSGRSIAFCFRRAHPVGLNSHP